MALGMKTAALGFSLALGRKTAALGFNLNCCFFSLTSVEGLAPDRESLDTPAAKGSAACEVPLHQRLSLVVALRQKAGRGQPTDVL